MGANFGNLAGNIAALNAPSGGMQQPMMQQPMRQAPGQYDPYTAARRPNYMPFSPNQQFNQPIYQPMYGQPFMSMQQMYPMPSYTRPLTPQPMQSQYRPIPYVTQTQLDAKAAEAKAAADAQAAQNYIHAKAGGKVHAQGIDSLLKK